MSNHLLIRVSSILSLILAVNTVFPQNKEAVPFTRVEDAIVGNIPHHRYTGPPVNYVDPTGKSYYRSDVYNIMIQEVDPYARTYYNIQSNGVTKFIWQDANLVPNIHAIFMVDPTGATGYPGRRTRYFFSNDTGNTWIYVSEVPSTSSVRSGYPNLIVLSNGREVVANHTTDGGTTTDIRTQIYVETGTPGDGLFSRMNPGYTKPYGNQPIWPVMAPTSSVSLTNKIVFVCSEQVGDDTCFWNVATGFGSSGPFLGYHPILNAAEAQAYAVAQGPNNRIAIAYITSDIFNPSLPFGAVEYIESTNSGSTWGSPVRVFTPNYGLNGLGALRSIDALYLGNNLRILFGLVTMDSLSGGFYPTSPAAEKLWGPDINNGIPVTVDSLPGMQGSNSLNGTDVLTAVCRGVLGKSSDGLLYASWMRARNDTSAWGDNYFDIYFGLSYDGGLTWPPVYKAQVTNLSGPLRNCIHPSISLLNYPNTSSLRAVHIVYQSDSMPGSNINGGLLQLAKMMYARLTFGGSGIKPAGSEIPERYALYQNYPNPFNPSTNIKFSLPKTVFITLKIYDILGREVITLISDYVQAGNKVFTYDGSNLASGIYFYTLTAGDFRDTKKMIIIK